MGLCDVREVFMPNPDPKRPDSALLQFLEICLTYNDFTFNSQWYLQTLGIVMGHCYAPSYANIYMSEWEREALAKCPFQPSLYLHFLDDIIGVWPHSENDFKIFIKILNDHHPSLNIKHTLDPHLIHFLDTTIQLIPISMSQNKLISHVYFKPTDTHALLHYKRQTIIHDALSKASSITSSAFSPHLQPWIWPPGRRFNSISKSSIQKLLSQISPSY